MKTKIVLIAACAAAAIAAVNAQQPATTPTPESSARLGATAGVGSAGGGVAVRAGIAGVSSRAATTSASSSPVGGNVRGEINLPAQSYGTRLNLIARRGTEPGAGSIILTSPHPAKDIDELSEDLTVLNYIFGQNLERTFGDRGTEYRLGVPITMRDNRLVETTYLQDFGILVKIHVPFPVLSNDEHDKKPENTTTPNNEWEKAKRALYGGGEVDPTATAAPQSTYDERIVAELKRQIFDALKNVANIRHMESNESVTVAVLGAATTTVATIDPLTGLPTNVDSTRPTVLTIHLRKSDIDAAGKASNGAEDLAKTAVITTYLDNPVTVRASGGGVGSGGYGVFGGYGGGFRYPPAEPAAR
jgi:hypothetical protein